MRPSRRLGCLVVLGAAMILSSAESARAIPAFARKYGTSCNTCHVAFPKLNDFGEAFRLNGFQITQDDEFYVKDAPVALGAEAWKDEFPATVWPGDIPHLPPISFLTRLSTDFDEGKDIRGDFNFPEYFNFLFAGTFGRDIGFFAHTGQGVRLYLQMSNIAESTLGYRALDAKIGLIEPAYVPKSNVRRLTITPYLLSTYTVRLPNGNGNDFQLERQRAIELTGIIQSRARWALGVTNGSNDSSDNNSRKDFYYRAAYKFGGLAFDGTGGAVQGESLQQTENWTDNSVTIGTFGYFGENTANDAVSSDAYNIDFRRVGFDVRGNVGNIDLTAGVLLGSDRNAGNDDVRIASDLYFAEAEYVIFPWLIGVVRFEDLEFHAPDDSNLLDSEEIRRVVPSLTALIRANLKVIVEGRIDEGGKGRSGDDALLLALDFSF